MNINVDELVSSLTRQTQELVDSLGTDQPLVIGIHTGGIWIAEHLHKALN